MLRPIKQKRGDQLVPRFIMTNKSFQMFTVYSLQELIGFMVEIS